MSKLLKLFSQPKTSAPIVESYSTFADERARFSTPFMDIGDGNLSLPYINSRVGSDKGMIYFGGDNLFPQLLNQMYYVSPLHSSIVEFKVRSVIGGGLEIDETGLSQRDIIEWKMFNTKNNLKRIATTITRDIIMHSRVCFKVKVKNKIVVSYERISPEKVRTNKDRSRYFIADDWSTQLGQQTLKPYHPECKDEYQLYCYELDTIGDYPYPIPQYSSCLNWVFLDGEMSYLHKSNIQNSIFASFMIKFPKKPASTEEKNAIKEQIEKTKGAPNAGRVVAFFANNQDQLPTLESIPVNNNDQLFIQTDGRIDEKICQAHTIDPILMGIRVSGKLGSGSDIKQAYVIWEKNFVIPTRDVLSHIFDDMIKLSGVKVKAIINNFQIINDTIVEDANAKSNKTTDALNSMSPLLATKVLETLTINEIRSLGGLKPIAGGDVVNTMQPQGGQV